MSSSTKLQKSHLFQLRSKITIIPSVKLDKNGVKTTQADGKDRSIALHQGKLDGACAVYSTIISLMCMGQINYEDVDTVKIDKRSPKGKFLSMLLEQRGMNMLGWNLKTLAQEINNTSDFNIKATAVRKDYVDRVHDNIQTGFPSIIGISFKDNTVLGHAIVCIGVEESEKCENTPVKLLCIDPGYPMPFTAYWNCVILLPKKYDDDTYFVYSTDIEKENVLIDDVIIFI